MDEAYADVVVTGSHSAIRELFLAIEGRFDAGVLVRGARGLPSGAGEQRNRFLGFDVTDIDVIRLDKGAPAAIPARRAGRAPVRAAANAQAMAPTT